MNITINSKEVSIKFDYGGNIYFLYDKTAYEFVITRDNVLVLEEIDINKNLLNMKNKKMDIGKLLLTNKNLENKIKSEDENNYLVEDDMCEKNDDDEDSCDEEERVKIYSNEKVEMIDIDYVNALYDIFLYEGSKDVNKMVLKTDFINDIPLYRVNLYKNGYVNFRAIGDKMIMGNIIVDKQNKLSIEYIKC